MTTAPSLDPATLLATLKALVSDRTTTDQASDGPPERVIAQADLDHLADREEARDERARWGGAA